MLTPSVQPLKTVQFVDGKSTVHVQFTDGTRRSFASNAKLIISVHGTRMQSWAKNLLEGDKVAIR